MHFNKKNILIVGSGGREHALGWKLAQSKYAINVYYAEGNGGTFSNINIKPDEFRRLSLFAKEHECFTIVGPEIPLANGIVDLFTEENLPIFGPTKGAALLESSKSYAKHFMKENQIPTPNFSTFSDIEKAKDHVLGQTNQLVIKADGLAAGKGVVVCDTQDEALAALDLMMVKNKFGLAGHNVIIEERLFGEEASFIAICDGKTIMPLASSKVIKDVMEPTVKGMSKRGQPIKGFIYAGIMVDTARKQPYVLEYNVRMGDPECQPIMMRLKSDLLEYLQSAAEEGLDSSQPLEWQNEASVCVIMAAKGYPGKYEKGKWITGLNSHIDHGIMIFHSGTKRDEQNRVVTNGGRVLSVCALGSDTKEAAVKAYSAVEKISWGSNEQYYRTDIGNATLPYQK